MPTLISGPQAPYFSYRSYDYALEIFLVMRYINLLFTYLLTYLLKTHVGLNVNFHNIVCVYGTVK